VQSCAGLILADINNDDLVKSLILLDVAHKRLLTKPSLLIL